MSERERDDAVIRKLIDERDIRAVLHRYATALDLQDWSLLATCFTPDATGLYETVGLQQGYRAIETLCKRALTGMSKTQHVFGNVDIAVNGDTAMSTCYLQAQHVRPNTPGGDTNIIAGRYVDDLVRSRDGWRISRQQAGSLVESGQSSSQ